MRCGKRIGVVIPALDEEAAIGLVVDAVPNWVDEVVVVDNGSADATAAIARAHGARVVAESRRGYGVACRRGVDTLARSDVVVFLDGDFSDRPEQMVRLVDPIVAGEADLVLGERVCDEHREHPMSWPQRVGNWMACRLINGIWRANYADLGPFRAIRRCALEMLGLQDRSFGWTVEMQIKAIRFGLRVKEVPTGYRPRIGQSKISGTFRGTLGAGFKILYVILRNALRRG